jgi:hypothetical protein
MQHSAQAAMMCGEGKHKSSILATTSNTIIISEHTFLHNSPNVLHIFVGLYRKHQTLGVLYPLILNSICTVAFYVMR